MHSTKPLTALLLVAGIVTTGCGALLAEESEEPTTTTAEKPEITQAAALTKATTETETVNDPVEKAFTVSMPKGWHNRAYSARAYDIHRYVVTSVSPNGDTVLYMGDPKLPNFYVPAYANPVTYEFAQANPLISIQDYSPAEVFFKDYTNKKFGKLPDFKLASIEKNEKLSQQMVEQFMKAGLQIEGSVAEVNFTYTDKGKPMNALILGMTSFTGAGWTVDVYGLSTSGDPQVFKKMVMDMSKTLKMNQDWVNQQNALHEARMQQMREFSAQMTAQHNQNMANIQASAQRHQARMEAIWAAGDASVNAYYERSAASDLSHQRFLNYINEESTVVGSGGQTFQVDGTYPKYFMKVGDPKSYVGGDSTMDLESLRKLGLNPNDYQEVKVRQ